MNTSTPTPGELCLVVGYVPHMPSVDMLTPEAVAGMTATKVRAARPSDTVAIVVGSSSQATHRVVGSVAVSLARRAPVPLLIVP